MKLGVIGLGLALYTSINAARLPDDDIHKPAVLCVANFFQICYSIPWYNLQNIVRWPQSKAFLTFTGAPSTAFYCIETSPASFIVYSPDSSQELNALCDMLTQKAISYHLLAILPYSADIKLRLAIQQTTADACQKFFEEVEHYPYITTLSQCTRQNIEAFSQYLTSHKEPPAAFKNHKLLASLRSITQPLYTNAKGF